MPFVGFVVAMSTMVQEMETQTSNRKARESTISHLIAEPFNPSLKFSSNADILMSW